MRQKIGNSLNITKTSIDLHKSFGVYRIINTVTGDFYIGKTSSNFMARWSQHAVDMNNGGGSNEKLREDWRMFGLECFCFEVIEVVMDKNILSEIEKYWIQKFFGSKYNIHHNRAKI